MLGISDIKNINYKHNSNMIKYVCAILIVCITNNIYALQTSNSKSQMPIIAYMGPIVEYTSIAEYKEMRQCGFTHTINIYNSVKKAKDDLIRAAKTGIKVYVHTPQIIKSPKLVANKLKKYDALGGYFLADEPNMTDINALKKITENIKTIDNEHPCYVNLHPYYTPNQLNSIGTKSYKQYLKAASTIGLPQISFDFYPITKNGLRSTWFYNLEEIRKESLREKKPFWGYILTVPHEIYPTPTLAALRLQAFVNLAYGAQALQYFTYRTPKDKKYNFKNALISLNGKKTTIYNLVKNFNKEINKTASLFYQSKIVSIGHLIDIPYGCKKAKVPINIKHLSVKGKKGAIVSIFNKNSHIYMAIINKDYLNTLSLNIKIRSTNVTYINKDLNTEKVRNAYTINAGDIAIFKLK